jgi:SP family arabinose:H+ symporter-like MFS transporter
LETLDRNVKPHTCLLLSSSVAALGGLLLGFDSAVIAGTTHGLIAVFSLTPTTLGITVSCALWGTVVGGLFSSVLGERLGGRDSLRIMAVLYFISALGCSLAWNWSSLLALRFIGGLGIGGSSVFGPMYIAEIAPQRLRGRLVSFFQLTIVIGILLAYASNYCLERLTPPNAVWRWEFGVAALPALCFLFALFGIPNGPRWLVKNNRIEEAYATLEMIEVGDCRVLLESIRNSLDFERQQKNEALFTRRNRLPLSLAIGIGIFNQFSGINAILYYLNDIFVQAGFNRASAGSQAIAVGIANLMFTLLAMLLIDRMGRRFLLLVGSLGMAACLAVAMIFMTGLYRHTLLYLLMGYVAFFAFSQGTVIWVYLSEIFPNRIREKGQSLGTFSLWLMNALIAAAFPRIAAISGGYPFVLFSAVMLGQFVVVLFFFPETKGRSLEQISEHLV